MRESGRTWGVTLAALVCAVLSASPALAHGGGGYRGPAGEVPPGSRDPRDPLPPPPPPGTGYCTVRGRVVLPDRMPAPGARIRQIGERTYGRATADENGGFEMVCRAGTARLMVVADGCLPRFTADISLTADETTLLGTVLLEAGAALAGVVRHQDGRPASVRLLAVPAGSPVPETWAHAAPLAGWWTVRTDSEGAFRIGNLPRELHVLHAYDRTTDRLCLLAGSVLPGEEAREFVLQSGVSPEPRPLAQDGPVPKPVWEPVTLVLDCDAAEKPRRVVVEARDPWTGKCLNSVDKAPEDLFLRLPTGRRVDLYWTVWNSGGRSGTAALRDVDPTAVALPLPARGTLRGFVARADGSAVRGGTVTVLPSGGATGAALPEAPLAVSAVSGERGAFSIAPVHGDLTLSARAPGLTDGNRRVFARAGWDEVRVTLRELTVEETVARWLANLGVRR